MIQQNNWHVANNHMENLKKIRGQSFVCPFWAPVETILCNMVDSLENDFLCGFKDSVLICF